MAEEKASHIRIFIFSRTTFQFPPLFFLLMFSSFSSFSVFRSLFPLPSVFRAPLSSPSLHSPPPYTTLLFSSLFLPYIFFATSPSLLPLPLSTWNASTSPSYLFLLLLPLLLVFSLPSSPHLYKVEITIPGTSVPLIHFHFSCWLLVSNHTANFYSNCFSFSFLSCAFPIFQLENYAKKRERGNNISLLWSRYMWLVSDEIFDQDFLWRCFIFQWRYFNPKTFSSKMVTFCSNSQNHKVPTQGTRITWYEKH